MGEPEFEVYPAWQFTATFGGLLVLWSDDPASGAGWLVGLVVVWLILRYGNANR